MLIGYARVSTDDQTAALQFDALTQAGCERTFSEHASRASAERPILAEALSHTRAGDTLVVWRLDRLGRSLPHLIQIVQRLEAEGVGLRSLTEGIDTTTAGGRLVFHLFGALAEFERELIRERTLAGLAAARAQGRIGGRPRKLSAEKLKAAQQLLQDPKSTVSGVARTLGVHRSTVHRVLQKLDAKKIDAEVERGLVQAG
ncbi:recombinase family protein [Sphingomonas sp. ID1715]|uniref:recombinase family protein n=1 Tax=Sphingomonas sp. ID1715 TaxID=1656898 RepID=UPI001489A2D6|nr:recombinase family protein [Sphingomonas sp. ID1715]NNM78060.1 recombinase family protein [Sphingomonas sp. ID1715]